MATGTLTLPVTVPDQDTPPTHGTVLIAGPDTAIFQDREPVAGTGLTVPLRFGAPPHIQPRRGERTPSRTGPATHPRRRPPVPPRTYAA